MHFVLQFVNKIYEKIYINFSVIVANQFPMAPAEPLEIGFRRAIKLDGDVDNPFTKSALLIKLHVYCII
jgi:hypothetical protein